MIDGWLRRRIDPSLNWAGRRLAALGVSATGVTLAGFGLGLAGIAAAAVSAPGPALTLLAANRIADGLDGAVARASRPTARGAFLDIVLDFLIYAGVVYGASLADPTRAPAAAFLILSFVGTGTTFLAFASVAAPRGLVSTRAGVKAIYYLGGLTEGAETIVALTLLIAAPAWFSPVAYAFGALCWVTTVTRCVDAWRLLGDRD